MHVVKFQFLKFLTTHTHTYFFILRNCENTPISSMHLKKSNTSNYQDKETFPYLYTAIIGEQISNNSPNNNTDGDKLDIEEGNSNFLEDSDNHAHYQPLLWNNKNRDVPTSIYGFSANCWRIMCLLFGGGCGFFVTMWLLSSSSTPITVQFLKIFKYFWNKKNYHNFQECCNSNLSKLQLWPFTPDNSTLSRPTFPQNFDPDQPSMAEKIRHKMMSVSLKYIVDFILNSENFHFSCPHSELGRNRNTNTTSLHPDQLDCQKYYECDENGRFTVKFCKEGQGFDNSTQKCITSGDVQICNDVGIFRGLFFEKFQIISKFQKIFRIWLIFRYKFM